MRRNNQRFDIYCETCGHAFKRAYPANPDTMRPYDCPRWRRADRYAPTLPDRLNNKRHRTICVDPFDPRLRPAPIVKIEQTMRPATQRELERSVPMKYRVKVTIGAERSGNALTFDSLNSADAYGIDLIGRWTIPDGFIVESQNLLTGDWELVAVRTRQGADKVRDRFVNALIRASQ